MTYYKIYNCSRSDFEKNFIEKVRDSSVISRIRTAHNDWEENRVFWGKIKNNKFKVYTYPDYGPSLINPRLLLKNAFVLIAPAYMSGWIEEINGRIDVKYEFSKDDMVYAILIFWIFMCFFILLGAIISVTLYGIKSVNIAGCILSIIVPSILVSRIVMIPKNEKEELENLLDDLAQDPDE